MIIHQSAPKEQFKLTLSNIAEQNQERILAYYRLEQIAFRQSTIYMLTIYKSLTVCHNKASHIIRYHYPSSLCAHLILLNATR